MKTIEELFVTEYEKQKETINDLNKEVDYLTERIKELLDDIKAIQEHHQATLDEVKRIDLNYCPMGYISSYYAIYSTEIKREFPILYEAGCIGLPEESKDGTK